MTSNSTSNEFVSSSSKLGRVFQHRNPKINSTPKEATTIPTSKPSSTVSTLDQWTRNQSLPGQIKRSKTDSPERQRRNVAGEILKGISALSAKIDFLQASVTPIQGTISFLQQNVDYNNASLDKMNTDVQRFEEACPDGFIAFRKHLCFKFFKEASNWFHDQSVCKTLGGHLTESTSEELNSFLKRLVRIGKVGVA